MSGFGGIRITLDGYDADSNEVVVSSTTANEDGSFVLTGIIDLSFGCFINGTDPRGQYLVAPFPVGTVSFETSESGLWMGTADTGDKSYLNPVVPEKRYRPSPPTPTITIPSIPTMPDILTGNVGVEGITVIIKSGVQDGPIETVDSEVSDADGNYGFDSLTDVYLDCALYFNDPKGLWFYMSAPSLEAPRYLLIGGLNPGSKGVFPDVTLTACGTISGKLV